MTVTDTVRIRYWLQPGVPLRMIEPPHGMLLDCMIRVFGADTQMREVPDQVHLVGSFRL